METPSRWSGLGWTERSGTATTGLAHATLSQLLEAARTESLPPLDTDGPGNPWRERLRRAILEFSPHVTGACVAHAWVR